jgi:hypothetical protein
MTTEAVRRESKLSLQLSPRSFLTGREFAEGNFRALNHEPECALPRAQQASMFQSFGKF